MSSTVPGALRASAAGLALSSVLPGDGRRTTGTAVMGTMPNQRACKVPGMENGAPSRTAVGTAYARADHQIADRPQIFTECSVTDGWW
ncbi:hypothetical protein ABZX92_39915 [Lentzea sp. NPDC006480]|uniref:hypothetical protein n=1 Tax=Lentzea sp. NPDC006480 TaxID=3157176 RepID=UPI0033B00B08